MPAIIPRWWLRKRRIAALFIVIVSVLLLKAVLISDISYKPSLEGSHLQSDYETSEIGAPPSASAAPPMTTYSPPLPGMALHGDANKEKLHLLDSFIDHFRSLFPPSKRLRNFKNPCWKVQIFPNRSHIFPITEQGNLTAEDVVCMPYFFMLGYPKCGTTTLHSLLKYHSDFAPAGVKEPAWWAHYPVKMENPMPAIANYLKMFVPASIKILRSPKRAVTGDCSTSNAFMIPFGNNVSQYNTDGIPYMISRLFPDAKFIVIMRDPVDRMCSQFYFEAYNRCPKFSKFFSVFTPAVLNQTVHIHVDAFNRCMRNLRDEHRCAYHYYYWVTPIHPCLRFELHISMYYHSLYQWLHYFPKRQFLFLKTSDLGKSPIYIAHAMYKFLEMSEVSESTKLLLSFSTNRHDNSNYEVHSPYTKCRDVSMWAETAEVLEDFYQPYKEKLFNLTNVKT